MIGKTFSKNRKLYFDDISNVLRNKNIFYIRTLFKLVPFLTDIELKTLKKNICSKGVKVDKIIILLQEKFIKYGVDFKPLVKKKYKENKDNIKKRVLKHRKASKKKIIQITLTESNYNRLQAYKKELGLTYEQILLRSYYF